MKTIEYCRDGEAIGDLDCEKRAITFLKYGELTDNYMKTSTSTFITVVRALICEEVISHKEIRFLFEGQYLYPNEGGRIDHWPHGFCDVETLALSRILTGRKK